MTATRRAVLVGVEEYRSFASTRYCHADVDLLARTLIDDCDYADADVKTIKPAKDVSPR